MPAATECPNLPLGSLNRASCRVVPDPAWHLTCTPDHACAIVSVVGISGASLKVVAILSAGTPCRPDHFELRHPTPPCGPKGFVRFHAVTETTGGWHAIAVRHWVPHVCRNRVETTFCAREARCTSGLANSMVVGINSAEIAFHVFCKFTKGSFQTKTKFLQQVCNKFATRFQHVFGNLQQVQHQV